MKPRPAKAALRPADGALLVIAATLRDRASFYRLCGDEHLAVALELEALLAEELARVTPVTDRPMHPES